MKSCLMIFFAALITGSFSSAFGGQVQILINEFMARNETTLSDLQGQYDDWIELYNAGDSTVNIGGLYITDDEDEPGKWQIPFDSLITRMLPGSYLILWADSDTADGLLHLNFKLSGSGESVILSSDSQIVIDQIDFGEQTADISFGRKPDGGAEWVYFSQPTPGHANSSTGTSGSAPDVNFQIPPGFYSDSVLVSITSEAPDRNIYYTDDASYPDQSSNVYQRPFYIKSTAIFRARVIIDSLLPGKISSATYFVNEESSIPVVSLISDPVNLWGNEGILSNRASDWEKDIHIEFFETDYNLAFNLDGGIKIHAPDGFEQQSFRLYARNKYGTETINYKLFEEKDLETFKVLVLRNGSNDGLQLKNGANLRDPLMHVLYHKQNRENGVSAYQPVNVFLNGGYFGIYNLRERQDKYYLKYNYGADENNLDFLERIFGYGGNRYAVEGSWDNYDAMRTWLNENDLSIKANYEHAKTLIDVEDFTRYWISEIFGGNFDWLTNNQKFWCERTGSSRWRWLMWDTDHALGLPYVYSGYDYGSVDWNTLEWATSTDGPRVWNGSSTLIVRNLLENEDYKNYFINLFADLLNTWYSPQTSVQIFDSLKAQIEPEVPRQLARWGSRTYTAWNNSCIKVQEYLEQRPDFVRQHIISKFAEDSLSLYTLKVNIQPFGAGKIKLNTMRFSDSSWTGQYFSNNPVSLQAVEQRGWYFDEWQADSAVYLTDTFTISPSSDLNITAVFKADSALMPVINEINYSSNSSLDTKDWVELYNPSSSSRDLTGWNFKDGLDDHVFSLPDNFILEAYSYTVLCRNKQDFLQFHPDAANCIGDFDFGLSPAGEKLRLFNSSQEQVDAVDYKSSDPWPEEPNGMGYTLELIDAYKDNSGAEYWRASNNIGGSPGGPNSTASAVRREPLSIPEDMQLYQNYPNPFNPETVISYKLPTVSNVQLKVYNILGQQVSVLVDKRQNAGKYQTSFNAQSLPSGTYFYLLQAGRQSIVKKMLLLR